MNNRPTFEQAYNDMKADTRYNVPKEAPKASEEAISEAIRKTEIYRRANVAIQQAQRKQVAYGIDKYPEPLNANTWSTIETIDHIIDESIDKLHYLVMLRIKLEQDLVRDMEVEKKNKLKEIESKLSPTKFTTSSMGAGSITSFVRNAGADTDGDYAMSMNKVRENHGFDKLPSHPEAVGMILSKDPLTPSEMELKLKELY